MYDTKPDPLPIRASKPRRICAVCGMVSYSAAGMHPQCAEEQADAARVARLKKARKSAKSKARVANPDALSPWHKLCPKCRVQLHVRKLTCDCGHQFPRSRSR
ncbi:MAG: hypothetical protein ACM3U2_04520 [Deltaproteobacteria bacterium]